ncbi:hypothetical protein DS909_03140 [Phaeobacter gallaeciensis]|uniref:Uncharacterized protein n=2 Tax=Roseobacteraceae TaxID=2854170 RepID=A0A366X9Z6_9RHOB|nr:MULTISPECIES: hypothetical protein [Roseobacteraceae]MBT3143389.1 hypothetical protein [Falsiruegeria litorea]MBT8169787.1 hypothetical protein [Falsiruegeria litorea]RBW60858.1 hypothetical protein DS909_03140 [Phaeobacter gallaeciensis]
MLAVAGDFRDKFLSSYLLNCSHEHAPVPVRQREESDHLATTNPVSAGWFRRKTHLAITAIKEILMQNSAAKRIEFELIAAELEVSVEKRDYFVEEALVVDELLKKCPFDGQ